jgi:hypothetical protein
MGVKHPQLLPGQGLAFGTNKRSAKYPDYTGEIKTPAGEVLQVAIYIKTTKGVGYDYLSIKTTEAEPKQPVIDPNYQPDNEEDH